MEDDLPARFYEYVNQKNWGIDLIQCSLHINNDLYTMIYTAMETEMSSHNILGNKLNQITVKNKLHIIFANIQCRFPTTFENIPDAWREKCLTAIAQKCNYNMRRRATRSWSPCQLTGSRGQAAAGDMPLRSEPEGKQMSNCP